MEITEEFDWLRIHKVTHPANIQIAQKEEILGPSEAPFCPLNHMQVFSKVYICIY